MPNASQFTPASKVTAGGTIAVGDLVEIDGFLGYGWRARITDYAKVAAAAAIATPSLTGSNVGTINALNRLRAGMTTDGLLYFMQANGPASTGTNNGLTVIQTTPTGGSPSNPLVLSSVASQVNTPMFCALSNGTMAKVWSEGSAPSCGVFFAIWDGLNNIIQPKTLIGTAATPNLCAVPLYDAARNPSGVGFSVCYQNASSNNEMMLATFDESGNIQASGPNIIHTWTASGTALASIALLQGGDLAYAASSGSATAGALGTWVGVFSPAGAAVTAAANTLGTSDASIVARPEIAVNPAGGFAVIGGITNWKIGVFNNSGILQGAQHITGSASTASINSKCITFDAGALGGTGIFAAIWTPSVNGNIILTLAPVTGAGINDRVVIASASAACMDAFAERNMIVLVTATGGNNVFYVIGLKAINNAIIPSILAGPTTLAPSSSPDFMGVVPGGDCTLIAMYNVLPGTSNGIAARIFKWFATAIEGVAAGSGSAGSIIPISDPVGHVQAINFIPGTSGITFNMTATAPIGRQGGLQNNSVVISG